MGVQDRRLDVDLDVNAAIATVTDEISIEDLQQNIKILNSRLDALVDHIDRLEQVVLGGVNNPREYDRDHALVEEFETIVDRHTKAVETAEVPLSIANRQATSDEAMTKTRRVEILTRNELIRRLAIGVAAAKRPMTVEEVHDKLAPKFDKDEFPHAIVTGAWNNLVDRWRAFEHSKNGKKAIRVDRDEVTRELVTLVQYDLDRDDLTKRGFSHPRREAG